VVCPDGCIRTYNNFGDAKRHANHASNLKVSSKRVCKPASYPGCFWLQKPTCPGGPHRVLPMFDSERQGVPPAKVEIRRPLTKSV
jgi:hypothetical protein